MIEYTGLPASSFLRIRKAFSFLLMKLFTLLLFFVAGLSIPVHGQSDALPSNMVDIVWLKDGSKLTGTILRWDLSKNMELRLATGALIVIPQTDIQKVMQDTPFSFDEKDQYRVRGPRPYDFKEVGWYHNASGFLNVSYMGGAGFHYAMGYRFSRMLGIGFGAGIESNDFTSFRSIIPVYAEARGFFLPKKITPYYALKLGYGIALRDIPNGTLEAKGGIHISPELGVRFGSGAVSYYAGLEYKIQNATFVWDGWDWTGSTRITDKVSYRRLELRTGLLF